MGIRIFTDSASDITLEELAERKVGLIPMPLQWDGITCLDDKTIPTETFWNLLVGGTDIKTSQPTPDAFISAFEEARQAGDDVICILISSRLSGAVQGAMLARSLGDYEKVYIIDAGGAAASAAEKLLVYHACRLRDEGKLTAREMVEDLERFRSRIRLFACIDTLEYLARGGRLSRSVAGIGTAMKIKPIIRFSRDGDIHVTKKVMGGRRAMEEMTDIAMAHRICLDYPVIPLYSFDRDNCMAYLRQLKEAGFPVNPKEPEPIGATIGAYIGPGGYGLAFVEEP